VTSLPASFYQRKTEQVAKDLVGMTLSRTLQVGSKAYRLSGIIVETEAYGHEDDEASHACRGMTERNAVMFGPAGRAYVYFTYGNHFCVNVSARPQKEVAGAVLIRGIEPVEGIDIMKKLRQVDDAYLLASGPGRLTQALGITRAQNGLDMTDGKSELRIEQGTARQAIATARIGITRAADRKWRFVDPSSMYISRKLAAVGRRVK
jgi:DNA-3-methyladenine glycosylase